MPSHSYSSIKDFQGCARRYYNVRVLRRFSQKPTEATLYGTAVHNAFERYLRDKEPLPEAFDKYRKYVEPLAHIPGEIHCEKKLGLTREFEPCDFFDDNVWLRGIPDLLIVNRDKRIAHVGDYKTGKSSRWADTSQLELMSAMVMQHYPEVNRVKGALLFVVAGDVIMQDYLREDVPQTLAKWAGHAGDIEEATVWNPRPSGLCGFCPVDSDTCEYR